MKYPERSEDFWKFRPFSRVVKGYKAYKIVRDYIRLNEQEVTGVIKYSKLRLKGFPAPIGTFCERSDASNTHRKGTCYRRYSPMKAYINKVVLNEAAVKITKLE